MKRYLIDTHILLWYLTSNQLISSDILQVLDNAESEGSELIFPTLVLVEFLRLLEKKKKQKLFDSYLDRLKAMPNIIFLPLTVEIVQELRKVSDKLNLHDRILVASARFTKAVLLTQDKEIIRSKAVETIS